MTKLFEEIELKNILHTALEGSQIRAAGKDKDGEEIFKIVISTMQTDRYGEIVVQEGIDTDNYLKNPVVLWGHDYYLPPIGKTIKLIKQKTKTTAYFVFAKTQFAQEIKYLVEEGFVNAASIGFMSREFDKDRGMHLSSELLEFSLIDVPANPGALAEGIVKLGCREVEEYICKKADTGCKIYNSVIKSIKDIRSKENEEQNDDLSNEDEEDNTNITTEETNNTGENGKGTKIFYDAKDISFLDLLEEEEESIVKKLKGEEEIQEEEKQYLDLICKMGLLIKKKRYIRCKNRTKNRGGKRTESTLHNKSSKR